MSEACPFSVTGIQEETTSPAPVTTYEDLTASPLEVLVVIVVLLVVLGILMER